MGFSLPLYLLKGRMLVTQSCLTLSDPIDSSPPDSSVHGVSQARILEGTPIPSPGDLLDPGVKPRSPSLQADSLSILVGYIL